MADDSSQDDSQKTEDPTPKRLKEMKDQGQVVMSREINSWVMLFAGTIVLIVLGPWMMEGLAVMMRGFIERPHQMSVDGSGLMMILTEAFKALGFYMGLPTLVLLIAAIAAPFVQIGPIFSAEPLIPKLSKISPISGFKRLFGMQALFEFFKGLVKIIVIGIVISLILWPFMGTLTAHVGQSMMYMMIHTSDLLLQVLIAVLAVLLILAVLDYAYQRHDFMKKARMSLQEIRDEYKQTEGDPHVKAKLRSLRQQRARTRMMDAVPKADVVITNPTHFAVALQYEPNEMNAPTLVAKGQDFLALKIREVAKENNIEIMENPPLARALYASMDIDDEIPAEHYKAVAGVIKYVFAKKGKSLS